MQNCYCYHTINICVAAVSIYTFIGFIYDGPLGILAQVLSLDIAPQFDKPYLSDTIASFWGQRWNLPMTMCLRQAIYEPITQGRQDLVVKTMP